jgi:hypothetical protein
MGVALTAAALASSALVMQKGFPFHLAEILGVGVA